MTQPFFTPIVYASVRGRGIAPTSNTHGGCYTKGQHKASYAPAITRKARRGDKDFGAGANEVYNKTLPRYGKHILRLGTADRLHVDSSRTPDNLLLVGSADMNIAAITRDRINDTEGDRKIRNDANRGFELVFVVSPGYLYPNGRDQPVGVAALKGWAAGCLRAGYRIAEVEQNVVAAVVHMDEGTPHMHLYFVPITPDKRLSYAHFFPDRKAGERYQDVLHEETRHLGLERGQTQVKHTHQQASTFMKTFHEGNLQANDVIREILHPRDRPPGLDPDEHMKSELVRMSGELSDALGPALAHGAHVTHQLQHMQQQLQWKERIKQARETGMEKADDDGMAMGMGM